MDISLLYMEDDRVTAESVRRSLERAGFAVEVANDGESGLAKLEYHDYNAAIIDYRMPGVDGLEVVRRINAENIGCPCIMLTGSGDEVVAVEAMKLGAADYVVKDLDGGYLTLLPAIIERVVRQHRLLEAKRAWEEERERLIIALQDALAQVKKLGGLLPICASCKKIRSDEGYWEQVDSYLSEHHLAEFSHSICPECSVKLYGVELDADSPIHKEIDEKKDNQP